MRHSLQTLLNALSEIGKDHPELYDSEVRERMGEVIMQAFVRAIPGYVVPDTFGLYSADANAKVRVAIDRYVSHANATAAQQTLTRFHDRLAAFQDTSVQTSIPGHDYEEFFGHTPPEFYDEVGNVLRTQ
jgi:hypothetical protein